MRKSILLTIAVFFFLQVPAQKKDTTTFHSPLKATIYSAVIPGAGQVYNHQAWKIPIIYGGLGALGYFVYDNNRIYKEYLNNWIWLTDNDSGTNVNLKYFGYSAAALHNGFSAFRQYRDQCAIGFILVYAANIMDANVYAHLYNFNVDDISLRFSPVYDMGAKCFTPGLKFKYSF